MKKIEGVPHWARCLTLWDPMDCIVHGLLQARIMEWVTFPFSGDLPNPGIEPRSSSLQADSLLAEPGKPKNVGVASLSLLQGIFPTQESNQGLLHCRWVLYQMSYQGRPPYWARYPIGSFAWYLLPVHLTTYNDTYWDMSRRQQGCRRRGDLVFPLCFLFLWTSPKCFSTLRAVLSWSSSWIQLAFFSNTWRASFIKSHLSLRL